MKAELKKWIVDCLNDNGYPLFTTELNGEWTDSYNYKAPDNTKYGIRIRYKNSDRQNAFIYMNNTDVADAIGHGDHGYDEEKLESLTSTVISSLIQGGDYKLIIMHDGAGYQVQSVINLTDEK